ncbi:MAG: hypothetical protein AAB921_02620, partial [Patescibacteria group bacterium]
MKRSLLAYNGFGTVFAILLWYGLAQVGLDPTVLFTGVVAGVLLCAGLSERGTPWWAIILVLTAIATVSVLITWGVSHANFGQTASADAKHVFIVISTFFLVMPICSRVFGTYQVEILPSLPGVPAFLAFAWFVNLGVWWGLGSAFVMFAA